VIGELVLVPAAMELLGASFEEVGVPSRA